MAFADLSEKSLNISRSLAIIAAVAAPISTGATSIACVALLIFWLLSGQALHTLKLSWQQPLGKMIVLFYAWLMLGSLYAESDWPGRLQTLSSWKKLLYAFILLGMFQTAEWQRRFVNCYAGAMVVSAVIGLVLWWFDLIVRPSNGAIYAGIFMTNHATQSMAFVAATLCCIFLLHDAEKPRMKYFLWAAIGLLLFNIFFISTARSSYIALPVAAIFAVVSIHGYRKLPQIAALAAIVALAFGLTSSTLRERVKLAMDEQANYQTSAGETSVGVRMIFYKNTLELIREKPWLGYGTSSFKPVYSAHAAAKYQDWRAVSTGDPHNQYMFVWLENGVFGLLLFLAYIYIGIRQGLKNPPYGTIAASFLIAIAASSLFNSHFKTYAEGYMLAFFLGALLTRPVNSTPPTV